MTTIKLRRDTAANWTSVNPTLAEGEVGIETDTNQQKIGDGVTAWNELPYLINYDSFDAPIVDYVAQTSTTWDETKLNYNSSSKVFTPMDTTANRNVYPITFIVPNNVNIDAYSTIWKFYIPNNNIYATVGSDIDNCCCQIYAESGEIAQLWYSANSWRRGDYSGGRSLGLNIYNNVPWDIRHYPANSTSTYVETIGGHSLSDGFTFNSSSGRLTKIVIYVNSQMNQNIAVGDVRLCLLDSGGNITEEYPLFTEGSQSRVKLNYNTDNLMINSNNQLDLSGTSKVIDGQWVENTIQLANGETLPDSTNIVYDLINLGCLPADATTYQYEIYLDCILYGSATSGDVSNLQVSAGVFSSRMCYVISRGAALRSSNSATLPTNTLAKLNIISVANNKGTFSLWFKGYRRIGTNV